jgi:hypothetical protein
MQTITNLEKQPVNISTTAPVKGDQKSLGSVIAARSAERQEKMKAAAKTEKFEMARIIVPTIMISAAFAMALLWDEMILIAFGG